MSSVESCQVLQISSLFTDELFTTQVLWLGCHIHKIWAFYEDSILRTTKKPDHRCWARFYVRLWNFIQVKKIRRRFIYPLNVNPLNVNPTKWSNTFKQFVGKSRQIIWVCLTILKRGCNIWGCRSPCSGGACGFGGCRVVAAVLGQRGKFLSFVAAGAIRLGALSMGSRGAYLRPHRAFSGFFGTIAAIFILVGGLGTGLSFCGLDTFLIFPNFLRS